MAVYLLDTNIFLRLYIRDTASQLRDCAALIKSLEVGQMKGIVPGIVIAEINWTLARYYKRPKADIIDFLTRLMATRNIMIENDVNWRNALNLHARYNVKFTDAIIASGLGNVYATDTIISYDRDFDKMGVKRLEPKGVLR